MRGLGDVPELRKCTYMWFLVLVMGGEVRRIDMSEKYVGERGHAV